MSTETIATIIIVTAVVSFVVRWILSFIRDAGNDREIRRRQAEEHSRKAAEAEVEHKRKAVLREKDDQVDILLRDLLKAKRDIQKIMAGMDEWKATCTDIAELHSWTQRHHHVMDFCVFRAIRDCFPAEDDKEQVVLTEEINQYLEDDSDPGELLGYVDEKLGIERGYVLVDGETEGGMQYEMADGRYEYVEKRLNRILRALP